MSTTQKQDVAQQSPAEVAAILEQAADHAGASASTYRRLAELMKAPGFAAGAAPVDIAKAMRDAFAQGWHLARSSGDVGYVDKRDAWIAQYMARLPGADMADVRELRKVLVEARQEIDGLRKHISDIYAAQNG